MHPYPAIRANRAGAGLIDGCRPLGELTNAPWPSSREEKTMVAISAPGYAQQTPYKSLVARAPDGVSIAAQDWGNPAGPEILFIHGFSQASLSWARQTSSELAKEFHIVTYDLRGHGNSDRPEIKAKWTAAKLGWRHG
jgi:non-heme chloroperoxidase